jgi:hypothetical protein
MVRFADEQPRRGGELHAARSDDDPAGRSGDGDGQRLSAGISGGKIDLDLVAGFPRRAAHRAQHRGTATDRQRQAQRIGDLGATAELERQEHGSVLAAVAAAARQQQHHQRAHQNFTTPSDAAGEVDRPDR